ncbi:ribonuclease R [Caulobacter sp. DWP3-1-3b2]|uniref:ribonuclease R n=1 Tax=Caulobacter sp. DWP3-1-3b2 TaxID=2804643 RepID=UPI003CF573CE
MPKPRSPKSSKFPAAGKVVKPPAGLPDRETLIAFLRDAGESAKADIARHFGLKGADRRALREMLRELESQGALGKRGRRGFAEAGALPPVGVADVVETDTDGDLFVRLTKGGEDLPLVRLAPGKGDSNAGGAPGMGDRLLVRFEVLENGETEARLIKRLGQSAHKILGVIRRHRRETRVEPVDRKSKESLLLNEQEAKDLKDGDLVLAQVGTASGRYGPKFGKVLEVVGREDHPRAASLIAIYSHGIPTGFSEEAEAEAAAAKPPTLEGRDDLRDLPFITIDPSDARDHDDAVYAHPDPDAGNLGGWIVWVAIADVAAYVRPGTTLDREAREKGNSVYFPDRVEPMLPEVLSNGLCSLREGENRATLAVRMVFDNQGRKKSHRFVRGLMRSAAKLSYEQAQAAIDGVAPPEGQDPDKGPPLLDPILAPLWAAFRLMGVGREQRSPLGIESDERKIIITKEGEIASITRRPSLEAHKLIEEMMIQANVCAAESLEAKRTPLIYRVHDTPSQEKVMSLVEFLQTLEVKWSKGEAPTTARFNKLLDDTRESPHAAIINEVVLRTQMQAHYSSDNLGHFGLNLARYAHFTSPIRRYADLIVHRALIRALKLGDDGLTDQDISQIKDTAEVITHAERRAMAAERDATDRYIAAFLSDRVGATFSGRITGVTRFGLFVKLDETGADGLVPVSTLGEEYFVHDDRMHALVGERTGKRFPLGLRVEVKLREATPVTGGLLFEMLTDALPNDPKAPKPRLGVRSRPPVKPRGGLPKGVRRGTRR